MPIVAAKSQSHTVVEEEEGEEEEEQGEGEEEDEEEDEEEEETLNSFLLPENFSDARRNGVSAGQSANCQCREGGGHQPETAALWHSHR